MEGFNAADIEKEVLGWINKARADPKSLLPFLEERHKSFKDKAWKKGDKWFSKKAKIYLDISYKE